MKASELRLGNKLIDESGRICTVYEVKQQHVRATYFIGNQERLSVFRLDRLQHIELTPEILEKAGLTHHKRTVSFNDSGFDPINFWYILDGLDEFNQRVYKYDFILGEFRDGFYYQARNRKKKGTKIESVHHFQNLIYALTHQELNIIL